PFYVMIILMKKPFVLFAYVIQDLHQSLTHCTLENLPNVPIQTILSVLLALNLCKVCPYRTAQLVPKALQPFLNRYTRFDMLQFYLVRNHLSRNGGDINVHTSLISFLEQNLISYVLHA